MCAPGCQVAPLSTSCTRRPFSPSVHRKVALNALNTSDGTICSFRADYEKLYRLGFPELFPQYLDELDSRLARFDLPLGASLEARPCGQVMLKVNYLSSNVGGRS
jgi:hypothetical protein